MGTGVELISPSPCKGVDAARWRGMSEQDTRGEVREMGQVCWVHITRSSVGNPRVRVRTKHRAVIRLPGLTHAQASALEQAITRP